MYPQEFADERYVPVIDLPVIIAGLLILALCVAAGYAFARLNEGRRQSSRKAVATSIHAAIQRKLTLALAAHGGATSNAAQALVDEIDTRLGDVIKLTDELGKPTTALRDAIAGKRKPPVPPTPPVAPAPHPGGPHAIIIPVQGQTAGGAAASAASAGVTSAAVAEVSSPQGGLVGAILHLPSPPPPVAPPPPSPPPPPPLPPTTSEIRAAVEAFAVYWGVTPQDAASATRIAELEAAAEQLTIEVPSPRPSIGGSAH